MEGKSPRRDEDSTRPAAFLRDAIQSSHRPYEVLSGVRLKSADEKPNGGVAWFVRQKRSATNVTDFSIFFILIFGPYLVLSSHRLTYYTVFILIDTL